MSESHLPPNLLSYLMSDCSDLQEHSSVFPSHRFLYVSTHPCLTLRFSRTDGRDSGTWRSCRASTRVLLTAVPHDASGHAVVTAPCWQLRSRLRSVAHYVADRGVVIPRSTPIVRRRSWDRAIASEGINRREEGNFLLLRSFSSFASSPSSSCAQSTPHHRTAPRTTPPPHAPAHADEPLDADAAHVRIDEPPPADATRR